MVGNPCLTAGDLAGMVEGFEQSFVWSKGL